ncbi:hypothetical protein GSF70_10105 [Flavobacteriaceae bacterium W22]|nr:hypothetical protein [Flavobacteriaceae bacterium W22]
MIEIFLSYLNQNKYSIESPVYKKYSSLVYPKFIGDRFDEYKNGLPDNFNDFVLRFKNYFNENTPDGADINMSEFNFKNLSSAVVKLDDVTGFISSSERNLYLFFGFFIIQYVHILTIISIRKRTPVYFKEDILKYFDRKIQFSQAAIAKEWEVDNDTLSKWLEIMYQSNPFVKRKRINLSEYLRVYNDFFILKNERKTGDDYFMIPEERINFYIMTAVKGKTYTKSEVIELGFNLDDKPTTTHYTQAKKILSEKFPYYKRINKFPNSWALELIEQLKVR